MNETLVKCFANFEMKIWFLNTRQFAALVICNIVLMVGNFITNVLVMYILVKTEQISNVTCKLIFMLSASDLLIAIFVQNLVTAMLYVRNCVLLLVQIFFSIFLTHVSMYTIAIIGIDRYVRIKHYVNFKTIWTKKVVFALIFTGCFLALFQAAMVTIGYLVGDLSIATLIYIAMDSIVLVIIIFLQVQTIRTSNAIHNESRIIAAERINKKITKLSLQIMLLFCFFFTPLFVVAILLRYYVAPKLNKTEGLKFEFFSLFTVIFSYGNCSANATLFLMTNVKAKRFLRDLIR